MQPGKIFSPSLPSKNSLRFIPTVLFLPRHLAIFPPL